MLEPVCTKLSRMLESTLVDRHGPTTPLLEHDASQPAGRVPVEQVCCDTCGERVALLVFAEGATDGARFEDYVRMMYEHFVRDDVPAWIIGPPLGSGPEQERPANILKVWPQRAPMECLLRPDKFHPRIAQLVGNPPCTAKSRGKRK